jgi:hypothetical protein
MKELLELRISRDFAWMLFNEGEGTVLGSSVQKVLLAIDDPRIPRIGELDRQIQASTGRAFFYGWRLVRRYTRREVADAALLRVIWKRIFEPAGEECGTVYDESPACQHCGVGRTQRGPLVLDGRRMPSSDFASTIAGENIVSERSAKAFQDAQLVGCRFDPVIFSGGGQRRTAPWYQLRVDSPSLEIVAPTLAGIDPFDLDEPGRYRCPAGHTLGLNLLSEISVRTSTSIRSSDFALSRQYLGCRRGLLRPWRVLLVSPRVYRLVESQRLTGWEFEVAHSV